MGSSSAQIINYLLFIVLVFMFIKTFVQAKQLGNAKGFSEAYSKVLADDLDAEENLDSYLANENKPYLMSQAYLLKAYLALEKGKEADEFIDKVDLKPIFTNVRGKFDVNFTLNNITFFLWVSMFDARCLKYDHKDLADKLNEKFAAFDNDLNNVLEYRLYKGIYAAVKGEKNDDFSFLKSLVNGEYPTLKYEKRYIGLYKREATIFLVYKGEKVDEFWDNDLHAFVDTSVGKRISTDLDLYNKYHVDAPTEPVPADEEETK